MSHTDYETVWGIPSGLITCRLGGESIHIAGISPRCVWLRTPEAVFAGAVLELCFYQPENGSYTVHTIKQYKAGEARCEGSAVLTRFFFDDSSCAAAIRRALNHFARYIEVRSECGASAYGHITTGYPFDKDECFYASIGEQKKAWFEKLPPLVLPDEVASLALELNCPALWKLYLEAPAGAFLHAYADHHSLSHSFLNSCKPDRIYVGNPYCRHLFPDLSTLEAISEKAASEGLKLTLVTAELRAGGETQADALLDFASQCNAELAVNDWGMLERACRYKENVEILLGTQLNRRRKDPRMNHKAGFRDKSTLLAENSLNSASWRNFLKEMGVTRFEYESCALPTSVPEENCCLHLPFYQTNTALWCPLQALCIRGDRGAQQPSDICARWCEKNFLLYPSHLNMLGKWNSLLAFCGDWNEHPLRGFDRWVLNF